MATSHLRQLRQLQTLAKELGYEATILEQSPDRPFDILSILSDADNVDEGQQLELVFYPENADLEGSAFLQFFYQPPFVYKDKGLQNIKQILPDINNRMSLGHFSISHYEKKIQFKYVLALSLKTKTDLLFFKDILEVCMYTPSLFQGIIHEVGTGQLKATTVLQQLNTVE